MGQRDVSRSGPVPAIGEPRLLPDEPLESDDEATTPSADGLVICLPGIGRDMGVCPGSGVSIQSPPGVGVEWTGAAY